jgi:ABC-type transporter Mla subunit MlaD
MALFSRKRKHPQHQGLSRFKAGLIAIVVLTALTYVGFTKVNPFANPYELKATFRSATNVKPRSPVRVAGVDVGEVKKVEALPEDGAAVITMEIKDKGLPIHEDAQIAVRTRIFLEGNVFLDVRPGTPSAGVADSGATIPVQQTSTPVQLGEVLAVLQRDVRGDLRTLLDEYGRKALGGGGAEAFNRSIPFGEPAFKNTALASDATLGVQPTKDFQRLLRGQQRTFRALARKPEALKGLVTNLNITAGALAREDAALGASIPALRDLLRVANPALFSLNAALPSLRAFSVDALPGVRSSAPTLRASLPFIRQLRLLVRPSELRGLARDLREAIPDLALLNRRLIPFLGQARTLSSCQNEVFLPYINSEIPNPDEPKNNNQTVIKQIQRGFPGLAGESRVSDANGSFFHSSALPPTAAQERIRPAPPLDNGKTPPPHRPDVPCETQEAPNLNAPGGPASTFGTTASPDRRLDSTKPAPKAEQLEVMNRLRKYLRDPKAQKRERRAAALRAGKARKGAGR